MEDYKILKAIGKGSFGKVYLVHHIKEKKNYVLKVIKVKGMPVKERCVPSAAAARQLQRRRPAPLLRHPRGLTHPTPLFSPLPALRPLPCLPRAARPAAMR